MTKIVVVVAIALFGSAAAGWFFMVTKPATGDAATRTNSAPIGAANYGLVRGRGYVEPASETRRLVFRVDGVIETCKVQIGDRVKKGAIIMALNNHAERAGVAAAVQQLSVTRAERDQLLSGVHPYQIVAAERKVDVLNEQAQFAQKEFERSRELFQKKATSLETFQQSQTTLTQAQSSLKEAEAEVVRLKTFVRPEDKALAEAKVQLAGSQLATAQERLNDTILLAPFDGTILEVLKREGDGAKVFDPEPVAIFGDTSRLRVRAEIDERFVSQLQVGQKATVYGHALGEQRIEGQIAFVKQLMGKKTVFSREAAERKDLDVLQVFIDMPDNFKAPVGLRVDVDVHLSGADKK